MTFRLAGLVVGLISVATISGNTEIQGSVGNNLIAGDTTVTGFYANPAGFYAKAIDAVESDNSSSIKTLSDEWAARVNHSTGGEIDYEAALGLATLSRLTYDYESSARRYREIIGWARRDVQVQERRMSAFSALAEAYLGLAWQADTKGDLTSADSLFLLARINSRSAERRDLEASAIMGRAMARGPVEGAHAAMEMVDSAYKYLPVQEDALHSDYWMRRAVLSAVLSRASATAEATRARRIANRIKDRRREAKSLGVMALYYRLSGNEERAIAIYDTVVSLQLKAKDYSSLAETLLRQGDGYRSRSQLYMFKKKMLEAAKYAGQSRNDIASRSVLLQLGALSMMVRDYPSADRYLGQSIELSEKDGAIAELMLARAYRANLYLTIGDIDRSRTETQIVADYHRRVGDGAYEFAALRDLIHIELQAKDIPAAERALRDAERLSLARNQSAWNEWLNEERGLIARARGDYARARTYFQLGLNGLDSGQEVVSYSAKLRIAEMSARLGDIERAVAELSESDKELQSWRSTLDDAELRRLAFQVGPREQGGHAEALSSTLSIISAAGKQDKAFELAENRRARELNDKIVRARSLVDGAQSTTISLTAAQPSDVNSEVYEHVLNPNTALVSYVVGAAGIPSTMFVLYRDQQGRRNTYSFSIPSGDSIADDVSRLNALIESGARPNFLLKSLGGYLLDSVRTVLGKADVNISSLIVVPDGPLNSVPFDALILSDDKHAVEHYSISITPSAASNVVLRERRNKRVGGGDRLLVYGSPMLPSIKASSHPALSAEMIQELSALAVLKGAAAEAREVARYGDSELRLNNDASIDYLRSASLSQFGIVHFATHAIVDERSSASTALVLASDSSDGIGLLFPGELASLPFVADLVVLSSCASIGGTPIDGEGVQGLTSSLLEAGAGSVVATRWRIDDNGTVDIVKSFYRELAGGQNVSEALRLAKLEAIRTDVPIRDWAAFTVVGDPELTVSLESPDHRRIWLAGLVVFAAVLAAGGFYLRSRRAS